MSWLYDQINERVMSLRGMSYYLAAAACLILLSTCTSNRQNGSEGLQLAILSDIHFHDVFGEFTDTNYRGIINPTDSNYALIRSMNAQLHSTRMFNENYFVFLAALESIVQRNIKYVIIAGDFSDDGQEVHLRALKGILEQYARQHGISFFLTIGNHDVVQPFGRESGKEDFLGSGGMRQPVMSMPEIYETSPGSEHPLIVTQEIKNLGYTAVMGFVKRFGFLPERDYIYWETPFSDYDYDNYSFQKARESAPLSNRGYTLLANDIPVPDVSYLVEPVKGLWLLALDGNTYVKKIESGLDGSGYVNRTGYNDIMVHRRYLVDWVKKVTEEAKKRGKKLITFSHYPMVDFNDGATPLINKLIKGEQRVPDEEVANIFADAGIRIHFGGHLHINDTGVKISEKGNTLVNIQVPSLAAYLPAYKILTLAEDNIARVETVVMDSVPGFDHFFELYEEEHKYLKISGQKSIWSHDILDSKNYREFINWHLRELVRLRYLPEEWSPHFKAFLLSISGDELLALSLAEPSRSPIEVLTAIRKDMEKSGDYWRKVIDVIKERQVPFKDFETWTGFDFLVDMYRVRGADELAFVDIGKDRLAAYKLIIDSLLVDCGRAGIDGQRNELTMLAAVFQKLLTGEPSDYFEMDLVSGEIFPRGSGEHPKSPN